MAHLNSLLRAAVDCNEMTRKELCAAIGISRTSLFHILRGTALPRRSNLDRLLEELTLDDADAAEIIHAFEMERMNTFKSNRKEVRSARGMFKASLLASLQPSFTCRIGVKGLPDFWVDTADGEVPVFAGMKIVDHLNTLGKSQLVRSQSGQLNSSLWRAWVCVSVFEPIYRKYQEDYDPFNLTIATPETLLAGLPDVKAVGPEASRALVPDNILCIT